MISAQDAAARFLDLLKKSVLGELYVENEVRLLYLRQCLAGDEVFDQETLLNIDSRRPEMLAEYISLRTEGKNFGPTIQNLGFYHTMIGRRRLENVETCLDTILRDRVPGDLLECGVWRGGTVVFMRGFLAAYGVGDRTVWVADSFDGLPAPETEDEGLDLTKRTWPSLAISRPVVEDLFRRYGLLDERVQFLEGWFRDTLPHSPFEQLALLRLDGDLYSSTRDALAACYDRVAPGGFIIVDDYGCFPQCRRAVDDFRVRRGIADPIDRVDWTGAFWRKS